MEKLLGINIPSGEIKAILNRLGFEVIGDGDFLVSVPNRRPDIAIKADLIEEIARIYGYDKITGTIPSINPLGGLSYMQKQRRETGGFSVVWGLSETYTYSLLPEKENDKFLFFNPDKETISVLMPITQDHKFLRRALVPGLVANAKYSHSRKLKDLALFEIGIVFYRDGDYHEEERLGLLISGKFSGNQLAGRKRKS